MTKEQQNRMRSDRQAMCAISIFDAMPQEKIESLGIVGTLSFDTSTPLDQTNSLDRESRFILDRGKGCADIGLSHPSLGRIDKGFFPSGIQLAAGTPVKISGLGDGLFVLDNGYDGVFEYLRKAYPIKVITGNESIVISDETSLAEPIGSKPKMPGMLEQSVHGSQIIDSTQAAMIAPITVKIFKTKERWGFPVRARIGIRPRPVSSVWRKVANRAWWGCPHARGASQGS